MIKYIFQVTAIIMTRGASIILICFLLATLLLFLLYGGSWNESRIIHFNMEISLLFAHFCLLPTNLHEVNSNFCRFISILIHFFYTSAFSFMFLESLHLFSLVGNIVKSGGIMSKWQNVLFGWLIPLLIVLFNVCFEYENYGGTYLCWLQMNTNLIYGQFVPIAFVTIISLAVIEAAGDASDYQRLQGVNQGQRQTAKIMQRTLVLILPLVNCF